MYFDLGGKLLTVSSVLMLGELNHYIILFLVPSRKWILHAHIGLESTVDGGDPFSAFGLCFSRSVPLSSQLVFLGIFEGTPDTYLLESFNAEENYCWKLENEQDRRGSR
jgi:hypothetical protein